MRDEALALPRRTEPVFFVVLLMELGRGVTRDSAPALVTSCCWREVASCYPSGALFAGLCWSVECC